ncbi:MAG TPA: MOSC domain-containing protein [Rhizomicrobium sp.]|nr:MOSC domain-containing protein [Rhizomicrobium sp.]
MQLRLVSVNVGMPREIGLLRGEPVLSGIAKAPLESSVVFVSSTNIEGDGQADLTVHGGVDKAIYCYPADHWPWWEREKGFPCWPAAFGENLTIEGADETMIAIGDRFRWGDVVLEVSQPRAPCFKFAIYAKRADAPALMTMSGRSGWYFRVIREGRAPVGVSVLARESVAGGPSVREAFFAALYAHADRETLKRVADAPALAPSWRSAVARRLRV